MKLFKYTYRENNSGGVFLTDGDHKVIVYAKDDNHANELAEQQGVYFDGVEKGMDCDCCGDRWYRAYGYDYDQD